MSKLFRLGLGEQSWRAARSGHDFAAQWRAGVDGNWNNAKRWSPKGVPNALDAVTIAAAGAYTVTVDTAAYAQSLTLNDAAATLLIGKGGNLAVDSSFAVAAGTLSLTDNAAVSVYGTLSLAAGSEILSTGAAVITASLVSAGSIDITAGRLVLDGGGSIGGSVTGAGAIDFAGGSFTSTVAALAVDGLQIENGGTLTLSGASGTLAASSLKIGSGALVAASGTQLTVDSDLSFGSVHGSVSAAGTLSGSFITTGVTTINDNGFGANALVLAGVTWSNSGTINDNGGIGFGYQAPTTIINQAGALFLLNGYYAGTTTNGPPDSSLFTNAGTLAQTDPHGEGLLNMPFDNTGLIQLEGGALNFSGGGTIGGHVDGSGNLSFSGTYTTTLKALGSNAGLTVGVGQGQLDFTGQSGTFQGDLGYCNTGAYFSLANAMNLAIAGTNILGNASFGGHGTLTTTGNPDFPNVSFEDKITWISTGTIDTSASIYDNDATIINSAGGVMNFQGGGFGISNNGSLINEAGSTIDLDNAGISGGTFSNIGTVSGASTYGESTLTGNIINTGTINAGAEYILFGEQGDSKISFSNSGSILTNTGIVIVYDNVSGAGTFDIGAGGELYFAGGVAASQAVDFDSITGSLYIGDAKAFLGDISGFGGSDLIDLLNTFETGYNFANSVLTVTDNGTTVASLVFAGNYTTADFSLGSDGNNGTFIKYV